MQVQAAVEKKFETLESAEHSSIMSPLPRDLHGSLSGVLMARDAHRPDNIPEALILEAWAQGLMAGALVVMAAITFANMRSGILLHKLILLELILALPHGTFIFAPEPVYGWYLSATAIGLIISWSLHNVIAWMKNKPFMSRPLSYTYIGTIILVQPYWVLEMYANFGYFNNINPIIYEKIRPWEALFRDPWWIYTTCNIFWVIKKHYNFRIIELVRECPRFGIMLASMCLSIIFLALDVMSVTGVFQGHMELGINPFWKLCFTFKCLCDAVILDDFKTALDKLSRRWLLRQGMDHCLETGCSPDDQTLPAFCKEISNSTTQPAPSLKLPLTADYFARVA